MLSLDTWKVPPHEDNPNTNPQLTEKLVTKSEYIFHLDNTNKKFDKIIACALTITKAYEPFFNKFNHCTNISLPYTKGKRHSLFTRSHANDKTSPHIQML